MDRMGWDGQIDDNATGTGKKNEKWKTDEKIRKMIIMMRCMNACIYIWATVSDEANLPSPKRKTRGISRGISHKTNKQRCIRGQDRIASVREGPGRVRACKNRTCVVYRVQWDARLNSFYERKTKSVD